MKSNNFMLLLFTVLFAFTQQQTRAQADIVLTNGKIFTSEKRQLYVQALAIKGNKIIAVGNDAAIEKLAGKTTKRIDLQGKTVVPGFNNAHDHLGWGINLGHFFTAEFSVPGPTKKAAIDSVAKLVKTARPGEWIAGLIGMIVYSDPTMRAALDSIAPNNPVQLQVMWGHGVVLNTRAMKLLHIAENEPDPLGGWYDRKPGSNIITGALHEYAEWPAFKAIAAASPDAMIKVLHETGMQQAAVGFTSIQHMNYFPVAEMTDFFTKAHLPQRVRIIPFPGSVNGKRDLDEWRKVNPHPAPMVTVSGIKYILDGTPFDESCMMKTAYPDNPKWFGRTDWPVDTIRQMLKEAYNSNSQLMMHIVGDSTMAVVLSMMKQIGKDEVWRTKRIRFEHNLTGSATAAEIQRIHDMGIIMAHTPKYAQTGHLQSFLDKGIFVSVSPDGTPSPFLDILLMTTQQADPKENITREEAVIAYTKTNAYAEFAEKEKGTLMPGMLADLAVLSADIFTISPDQLLSTHSILTIIDGKIVYQQQ